MVEHPGAKLSDIPTEGQLVDNKYTKDGLLSIGERIGNVEEKYEVAGKEIRVSKDSVMYPVKDLK